MSISSCPQNVLTNAARLVQQDNQALQAQKWIKTLDLALGEKKTRNTFTVHTT